MDLKEFKQIVQEEKQKLIDVGIYDVKRNEYTLEFSNRMTRSLGMCTLNSFHNYTITLNKKYTEAEDIFLVRQTIMHELIHSCVGCMSHTGRWKVIANVVNKAYNYNISRTTAANNYNIKKAKYKIVCSGCGNTTYYFRHTKITKNPEKFYCIHCYELGIQHELQLFLNN